MEYTEVAIRLNKMNPFADILVAKLDEIQFESYAEELNILKAYIQTHLLDENAVKNIINQIGELTDISFTIQKIKNQNWNQKWESNYKYIFINDVCVVRSDFHTPMPEVKYEIIISPKMSFGTGHHETTSLIMNQMFEVDFKGKSVLDMGSGTGILSILASKLGAVNIVGIDSDEWAFKNAIENSDLNNLSEIRFIHGDSSSIPDMNFDIVLVNINRNIILQDMRRYINVMKDNAAIILSGFLKKDFSLILERSIELGLELVALKNKNKWQMAYLRKA